jgi:hypothetical protein
MTFRIKSKYVFCGNILQNGNWSNELPELSLSQCDDSFLTNRMHNTKTPLFVQPDRIKFCNIFNIIAQNVTYSWFLGDKEFKNNFSINKGLYTFNQLEKLLNTFDKRIQFKFDQNETNKFKGQLTVKNVSLSTDIKITMNKNLLMITGLIDMFSLLNAREKYIGVPCKRNFSVTSHFDMSRTIKEIKLYSKYLFDYKTELCCKVFTSNELKCLNRRTEFFNNEIQSSNINSKIQKVDRFDMHSSKFYFVDFFDEPVYFDFCEIVVFISNK